MYTEPFEQHNGVSTSQNDEMIDASTVRHAKVSVTENGAALDDVIALNGKDDSTTADEQSNKAPESALEQLANQPEAISKYTDMTNDVKEMDIIAFKVFTPNFEQSNYIIGLVESIVGRTAPDQQDYDLVLQIMGKNKNLVDLF